ncbi:FAD-dependent oxidoreductase [Enterococcus quebecensis]|uniref:CoA-disulfide reductase n=1 Tax=Enterococcus quebecensis TaxID=903983 RepID=A0A1E5H3U1_9ENTE|nr:FAD-dependent oxidoreductase [Enterococcus quebecensis]OEG19554.1 CoA-disulfide reductase [Enterococcus quebecensis]OJG75168.1 coenzyme A disulfide reductase [Enterococcus quebecensis]
MRVVIIGGVAGGMSAATRLRRLSEEIEIIVLEKGPYVSFANCGLPYYVSGEISERSELILQTPEQLKKRFNIDVYPETEAIKINRQNKTVLTNSKGQEEEISYDKLILSPGAEPVVPAIEGLDEATNVYTLRNVPDVDKIVAAVKNEQPKKAVVIGAGFIGLEMAENLQHLGIDVTLVEAAPQILPPLDEEMAAFVEKELKQKGITVYTGAGATAFKESGKKIELSSGETITSDFTILSIGVKPSSNLAVEADLETGLRGGIVVNQSYQTNDPDVYAVGDAIVVKQQITGDDALISLASPANRQGRQVADVIAGVSRKNQGSIGTAIVRVFDLAAASTGLSERQLRNSNIEYKAVHTTSKSHVGYFPGSHPIIMKLLFHPTTGKIYGAQAIGADGVDKRIDIIATAIKAGLTVMDLPELEFTYAPPFGSAKDPVNMIGYAAANIMEGFSDNIQYYELKEALEKGAYLLDVRNPGELKNNGALPHAENIPLDELRERLAELPTDKEIIVSCQSGQRSYLAERILKNNGFTVKNLDGAFQIYSTIYPQEVIK